MYNLIISALSSSSVYIFSPCFSLRFFYSLKLYHYIHLSIQNTICPCLIYFREIMLYYFVLIENLFTWWPHDSSLIMALMLSPRHNGIHDGIYLIMQFIF